MVSDDRLQQANGLLQVVFRVALFVGPLMPAPLLALGSLQSVPVVNGLSFLGAGLRAVRAAPDVLVVLVTLVLALALTNGFPAVGWVAVVGQGGQYGLLLGIAGVAEVVGALLLAGPRIRRLALAAVLGWALLALFRAPWEPSRARPWRRFS